MQGICSEDYEAGSILATSDVFSQNLLISTLKHLYFSQVTFLNHYP